MPRVIINGRFLTQRITGVQRYAREIISELDRIVKPGEIVLAVPPEAKNVPSYENIEVVRIGRFHNQLWEQLSFPLYVLKRKAVSLNLCNVSPLISPGVVCIHDMKIQATPQYFSKKFLAWYKLLFANAAKRARAIITVSDFSQKEIFKYYKVNSGQIHVIPNAWQHYERIKYDECSLKKYGLIKDEYFFALSSLEPNKNFKWIAEAARNNPSIKFAVAGAINEKVFADGFGFECPDNMTLLGYISDQEAKTLMRDCKAFLFPTFYEGFGIPPLEAMSAGAKNIYLSDTAVMHEIFGNSVQYIDPSKYETFFDMNCRVHTDEISKVLEKYSWRKSAKKLWAMINRMRE